MNLAHGGQGASWPSLSPGGGWYGGQPLCGGLILGLQEECAVQVEDPAFSSDPTEHLLLVVLHLGQSLMGPCPHPGTLPALSTATGLAPSPWRKATGHLSRHLPRTHPAPGSPSPQLAHLVLEALSLKVLQELKVDIPALSVGVTVDHKDVIPRLRGLGLQEGGVDPGRGWTACAGCGRVRGTSPGGAGPGRDSPYKC